MSFHIGDYRKDTAHLNAALHGAYFLLIMHYWATGGLPDDDRQLCRIACMTAVEWRRARPVIQAFFRDGWRHKRIEQELADAQEKYERRAAAGKRGGDARATAKQSDSNATSNATAKSKQPITDNPNPISSLRSEETRAREVYREPFDEFWKHYPHKVGKQSAYKAFVKAMKSEDVTAPRIMFALEAYRNKTDDRPWCNPATWLNEGRWDDQPAEEVCNGKSVLAAFDRLEQQLTGGDDHPGGKDDLFRLPPR